MIDRRPRRPLFSRLGLVLYDRGFGQEAGGHLVGEATEVVMDHDFESYEEVQRTYHAKDAFVPLESKIRFMQPSAGSDANAGPDRLWRLKKLWYDLTAKSP